ncbi:hypothetical protein WICPIJ_010143 [Wickerhamomyces pijperi]|uniref:TOM13-domain-containing protein n=1 Tax=Wickerhamomyces pijperi TaxID=599730 RepID=A0A9P8PIQ9_WICPI|nr:hypothetical protein WICPIJ_010143 [Wickerhamomyces pijperi]
MSPSQEEVYPEVTQQEETITEEVESDSEEDSITSITQTSLTPPLSTLSKITTVLASLSINLFLPFLNGLMLGFGELVAHEVGLKWGWFGANVYRPAARQQETQRKTKLV